MKKILILFIISVMFINVINIAKADSIEDNPQLNNNNSQFDLINYNRDIFDNHGKGVKIAILDTRITHNDIDVKSTKSFLFKQENEVSTHGNSVAGVIANNNERHLGIANESEIYSVEVLDKNVKGNIVSITSGLEWAINNDIDIVNLSISLPNTNSALDKIMKKAEENDMIIVTPVGNNEYVNALASYKNVVTVGSTNNKGILSEFSNSSKYIDITAPGENIYTTSIGSEYHHISGTSLSTAFVSVAIATLKSNSLDEKNTDIVKKVLKNTTNIKGKKEYGKGLLNMNFK